MFQKPNSANFGKVAVQAAGLTVGAKVSDGVAAIMPESTNSYKSWILAAVGIAVAASVNPSTQSGQFVQSLFLGMGGKQLANGVTEVLTPSVGKQDSTTTTGKFLNAVIGHPQDTTVTVTVDEPAARLAMAWDPAFPIDDMFGNRAEKRDAISIAA